jgi:hypothetical protein
MDTNENPTAPAPAGDNNENESPKKRRDRSGLNKAELRELNLAEQYFAVASRPERLEVLVPLEIDIGFITAVTNGIKAARGQGASATQNDTGKESATLNEQEARANLVTAMRCVQAAAKRKYARTQPEKLDDYAVGKNINASRPVLEEHSAQFLEKLNNSERPPSINTAFITKLATARSDFMAFGNEQGSKQSAASGARDARKQLVATIKDRRLELQFAADGAWPPGTPGNAAIRREFGLPPDRFLSVRRKKTA